MQVYVFNHLSSSLPVKEDKIVFIVNKIFYYLAEEQILPPRSVNQVTIIFKDVKEVQKLNKCFRSKDQPTDILSFQSVEPTSLGEIVLAMQIILSQAAQNQHSILNEVGYLVLHGILHLLGYEHEFGGKDAEEMMCLQDNIFEQLRKVI